MHNIVDVVRQCLEIKKKLVEEDPFDQNKRMLSNVGHTLCQGREAYEKYQGYGHGEAVAVGMDMMAQMGEAWKITAPGTGRKIRNLLQKIGLPCWENQVPYPSLLPYVAKDKKRIGDQVQMVMLKDVGEAILYSADMSSFEKVVW